MSVFLGSYSTKPVSDAHGSLTGAGGRAGNISNVAVQSEPTSLWIVWTDTSVFNLHQDGWSRVPDDLVKLSVRSAFPCTPRCTDERPVG